MAWKTRAGRLNSLVTEEPNSHGKREPWGRRKPLSFADTGWAEQHIVPDVALGCWEYQLATADQVMLRRGTWPILKNVAEWIESRGTWTPRGFEILHVMGPDESNPISTITRI